MFLIIFTLFQQLQAQCLEVITELTIMVALDRKEEFHKILPYLYLSGKNVNDYGQYETCLRDYEYAIFQFYFPQAPVSLNFGICVTKLCPLNQLNASIVHLEHLISLIIKKNFNINMTDYKLILSDSQAEQTPSQYILPLGAGFGILLMILLGVTLRNKKIRKQNIQLDINQVSTIVEVNENDEKRNQIRFERFDLHLIYKECWKPSDSKFDILNGIRVIAFLMTTFGCTGIAILLQANFVQLLHYQIHIVQLLIFGCLFSVDIFLWLSGFFSVIKLNEYKHDQIKYFLKRVWKFWILQAIVIAININVVPLLGDGPRWFYAQRYSQDQLWWENLLFINNLDDSNACSLWLWYLALDIQMSLLALIIMSIHRYNPNFAVLLTSNILVLSQALCVYICITKEYSIPYYAMLGMTDIYPTFYFRPWFRAPPYLIGMLLGFLKIHYNGGIRLWVRNLFQLIGLVIIAYFTVGWYDALIYGDDYYPKLFSYLYEGNMRFIYAIGASLFALPNILGYSNWLSDMFNVTFIKYIVKWTFSAYLVHFIILEIALSNFYGSVDFNVLNCLQLYVFIVFLSFFIGYLFRMFIELPLTGMKKIIAKTQIYEKLL